jgi:hypothetical protein
VVPCRRAYLSGGRARRTCDWVVGRPRRVLTLGLCVPRAGRRELPNNGLAGALPANIGALSALVSMCVGPFPRGVMSCAPRVLAPRVVSSALLSVAAGRVRATCPLVSHVCGSVCVSCVLGGARSAPLRLHYCPGTLARGRCSRGTRAVIFAATASSGRCLTPSGASRP